jgi:hypothetical protein
MEKLAKELRIHSDLNRALIVRLNKLKANQICSGVIVNAIGGFLRSRVHSRHYRIA